ncbi:diacylglycerol/lipid kinase family protein, partial [Maricaulis sp. CAU 1757]
IAEALESAVKHGADAIAIAGGDGTIRAVAEEVARSGLHLPLLPLPLGTANLLAKRLYGDRDAFEILEEAHGYREDVVPAGILNGHLFLVAAAIGFPSLFARAREVLRDADRPTPLWDSFKRALVSFQYAFRPRVRYKLDRSHRAARQKASGIYLSIRADDPDGFDCIVVHWRHFWDLLSMPWEAMAVNESEYATTRRTRVERVVAKSSKPLSVMVDGEPIFLTEPAMIRMIPNPLAVLRPEE